MQSSLAAIDYADLRGVLAGAKSNPDLFKQIVNAPFAHHVALASMFLGIIVLLLVDKESGTINRVAITDNQHAERTQRRSVKKFAEIKIPLNHSENAIAIALSTGNVQIVTDWYYLFVPELTVAEAHFNQADGGVGCSYVYPLKDVHDGAALIYSYYNYPQNLGPPQHEFMDKYAQLVESRLILAE